MLPGPPIEKLVFRLLVAGVLAVAASGCSLRSLMIGQVAEMIETGLPAFEEETDLDLVEKAFPANIKLLETLLAAQPENRRLLLLLSRLYGAYTFSFFEGRLDAAMLAADSAGQGESRVDADRAALNRYYLRAAEYAMKALEYRHPGCRKALARIDTVQPFLDRMAVDDVPALFWYAFNLGAYANQNRDSIQAVAKAHLAQTAIKRVIELDAAYYNGGAHLFLMIYYASRPPMMGGNPEKALHHYKRLKAQTGKAYLLADVYHARYYLYRIQDRQQYEDLLLQVIRHPAGHSTYGFFNAVALKRAALYLTAADRLFE